MLSLRDAMPNCSYKNNSSIKQCEALTTAVLSIFSIVPRARPYFFMHKKFFLKVRELGKFRLLSRGLFFPILHVKNSGKN
jgi:hypothetical protein